MIGNRLANAPSVQRESAFHVSLLRHVKFCEPVLVKQVEDARTSKTVDLAFEMQIQVSLLKETRELRKLPSDTFPAQCGSGH